MLTGRLIVVRLRMQAHSAYTLLGYVPRQAPLCRVAANLPQGRHRAKALSTLTEVARLNLDSKMTGIGLLSLINHLILQKEM
jgi:hypothetical protein